MERIIVVGPSGAGKSTLAATIARSLGIPHIELDGLWWDAGWTEAGRDVFVERIDRALPGDRWVVDGNYFQHGSREVVWPLADTIVWLDLSRPLTIARILRRTTGRVLRRTELWNGNRETPRDVVGGDSLLWFAWRQHPNYRIRYEALQRSGELPELTWVRLRSRAEVKAWLATLDARPRPERRDRA